MKDSKIIIADDHPLLLEGLKKFLNDAGYQKVMTAEDGLSAYHQILKSKPEIAILDINMPKMTGIELLKLIQKENLDTKVIIMTLYQDETFYDEADALGVYGYLFKHLALKELEICIDTIQKGEKYASPSIEKYFMKSKHSTDALSALTPSERKILKLISKNYTSPEIAELLFISLKTVTKHRSNIVAKLGLEKKTNSLLLWARENKGLFQ